MTKRQGFLHANDASGEHPSSYYAATVNQNLIFPSLSGDQTADVCVIGAGYTGLSAALHLAQSGFRVSLLEAHRVGWGASGRNGGQLGSGQRRDQHELEVMLGKSHAHALWALAEEAKALVKALVSQHAIDCELKPGLLYTDHKPALSKHSRAFCESMHRDYDYHQLRFMDCSETRHIVGSNSYYSSVFDAGAAHLHPLNFALGLACACQKAGVSLYEHTQVLRLRKGTSVQVETEKGTVKAPYVVLACNGYLDDLENRIASRVMPINNYMIATEPLSEALASSLIRRDIGVADSKFVVNYFRLSHDKRLLFGGGESYSFRFPQNIKAFVRAPMLKIFPQLKNTKLEYGWGGTLAITMNRMPYFARLDGNILNASGFSGHGVALAVLAGQLMAEAVNGQASRFDVMAQVPTSGFPGGRRLRWPLMVLGMLYYGLRDRL